ncbi:MAG: hypothetical protein II755_11015, partial [Prevotella sp.]|nr:hypothetical protein [Prevotella sp.]
ASHKGRLHQKWKESGAKPLKSLKSLKSLRSLKSLETLKTLKLAFFPFFCEKTREKLLNLPINTQKPQKRHEKD